MSGMLGPKANRVSYRRASSKPEEVVSSSPATDTLQQDLLRKYEEFIGATPKFVKRQTSKPGREMRAVVFSDTHIPEQRMDLIADICRRHEGSDCYIVGDVTDFESYSKHDSYIWDRPNIRQTLASTDAFFEFITDYFPNTYVLLGNHDNRLQKKASRVLGEDYAWLCHEALIRAYQSRHGVEVISHNIIQEDSDHIPEMHYWHQVGDCVMSHAEFSGRSPSFGVQRAHDFFLGWKGQFDLSGIRVILQAHTHKQSYFRHAITGIHCYELGTMCKNLAYMVHTSKYMPVQPGYFYLVQKDGVTDLEESRLYSLE